MSTFKRDYLDSGSEYLIDNWSKSLLDNCGKHIHTTIAFSSTLYYQTTQKSLSGKLLKWHHDTQHNDTQHIRLTCDTQHKWHLA